MSLSILPTEILLNILRLVCEYDSYGDEPLINDLIRLWTYRSLSTQLRVCVEETFKQKDIHHTYVFFDLGKHRFPIERSERTGWREHGSISLEIWFRFSRWHESEPNRVVFKAAVSGGQAEDEQDNRIHHLKRERLRAKLAVDRPESRPYMISIWSS